MSPTPVAAAAPAVAVRDTGGRSPRHVWDYWRIIWEGRRILLRTLAITLGVALVGTFTLPKQYRAETLVEITLSEPTLMGVVAERGGGRSFFDEDRQFKTEFVKIKTRGLLGSAITKHDLTTKVPKLAKFKDPIEVLRRCVDVDRLSQTNVATLSVSWTDPREAALMANAVADTYVFSDLEERTQELQARVEHLRESLGEKSAARKEVIEHELAIIATEPPLETILGLSTMKEQESLQKLYADKQQAERELSGVRAQFGPANPAVMEKEATLQRVARQVEDSRAAAIDRLRQEFTSLGGDLTAIKPDFAPITEKQQEQNAKLEEQLRARVSELQILAHTAEPKAHIIDAAMPPLQHYSPRLWLNLALALVVGCGFGGGLVFFRDYLDVSVKTLEDVEQDLGLNLLAVIPHREGEPDEISKEAFQTLRTGLLFASGGRRQKLLLITSGAPQEGKSTVVIDIARSIAAAGESVIVVDCDLRRASVSRLMKVGRAQGISNYLADSSARKWKDFVVQAEPGVAILPTGPVPPNPQVLLGLPRFRELLGDLQDAYDWVLLDSPPVSSVSDAVVLASLVEMVVVVMRHDQTDKEVIRRALVRLRGVGANVIGAVLNDVDMSRSYNREYYYGRFYYGHYYGQDGAGPSAADPTPKTGLGRLRNLLK